MKNNKSYTIKIHTVKLFIYLLDVQVIQLFEKKVEGVVGDLLVRSSTIPPPCTHRASVSAEQHVTVTTAVDENEIHFSFVPVRQ